MLNQPPARDARGPMRVMFVITSMPVGGAETLLVNLIRGMNRDRFMPELCCLKQPGPLGEELAREIPTFSQLLCHKFDLRVHHRLKRLFRSRRTDAVVTVGAGDKMFWGRLAARAAGVPVVLSALHSTGWPDGLGRLNRWLTPYTDAFIAVAHRHGQHLVHGERIPEKKVRVIPNGVDTQRFRRRTEDRTVVRRSLNLPPETPVCGMVAALRPEKNHARFLQVASLVRQQLPTARFLVVGDGPLRGALESLAEQRKLTHAVTFLGMRHDVAEILSALDVLALTSDNEASPVSILEAMAAELPIVATRVGSVEEVIQHGVHGLLADRHDVASIADNLVRLLRDPGLAAAMGRRGRAKVCAQGSLQAMIRGYESLLEDVYGSK